MGNPIESAGWISVYGVDKSAPHDVPDEDGAGTSLYDPSLGNPPDDFVRLERPDSSETAVLRRR